MLLASWLRRPDDLLRPQDAPGCPWMMIMRSRLQRVLMQRCREGLMMISISRLHAPDDDHKVSLQRVLLWAWMMIMRSRFQCISLGWCFFVVSSLPAFFLAPGSWLPGSEDLMICFVPFINKMLLDAPGCPWMPLDAPGCPWMMIMRSRLQRVLMQRCREGLMMISISRLHAPDDDHKVSLQRVLLWALPGSWLLASWLRPLHKQDAPGFLAPKT